MILDYRRIKIELSSSDFEIWLEHMNPENIKQVDGARFILPGRCPFCDVFRLERKGRESNCTECPLIPWGVYEGRDRIDGCLNLMMDILGDPALLGAPATWGLYFTYDFVVVIGYKGRQSVLKLYDVIKNSVVDPTDRKGVISHLETKEKTIEKGTGEKSQKETREKK